MIRARMASCRWKAAICFQSCSRGDIGVCSTATTTTELTHRLAALAGRASASRGCRPGTPSQEGWGIMNRLLVLVLLLVSVLPATSSAQAGCATSVGGDTTCTYDGVTF